MIMKVDISKCVTFNYRDTIELLVWLVYSRRVESFLNEISTYGDVVNVFVHSSCHEGLAVVQRVRIVSYVDRWQLFPTGARTGGLIL